MADTLKQFGNNTSVTYQNLQDGVSLVSTSGSQKAVIKDISLDNSKGRNLNISIDSKSGTKVASSDNKVDTLAGNLILDNSQSLHLSTDVTCGITHFRARGWGDGDARQESVMWEWGNIGTKFSPDTWDGVVGTPNVNDSRSGNSSVQIGFNLRNPANMFVANGYIYWHHLRQGADYSVRTMHRTPVGSTTTVTSYGTSKAYVMAYDGSRYIYTLEESGNTMRKYDTTTLGTSDTYTTINLIAPDTTSTAQTLTFTSNGYTAGSYYRDGYLFVNSNGETSTATESRPIVIEVATGKTKRVYFPTHAQSSSAYATTGHNYFRMPLGIAKDSSGVYWAFMATVSHYGSNNDNNRIFGCSLGSNPSADFIADGKTYGTTFDYKIQDFSSDSTDQSVLRTNLVQTGYINGNSCGAVMYTPGLNRYLYTYVERYATGSTGYSGLPQQDHPMVIFDFDNVTKGIASFVDIPSRPKGSESWAFTAWVDPDVASSTFGSVKARTAGILIT